MQKSSLVNNTYTIAVDIGSPKKGHFGWADTNNKTGDKVESFLEAIKERTYFSLGIEAPLFIPLIGNVEEFTNRRLFDDKHPWSAGAGACTAAITLGFLARVFSLFVDKGISVTTDINIWKKYTDNCILIWEAFITGSSQDTKHKSLHIDDARIALKNYCNQNKEFVKLLDLQEYLPTPLAIALQLGIKSSNGTKSGLVIKGGK